MWGVVTAMELTQHPLAKTGHRQILFVTQTLPLNSIPITNARAPTKMRILYSLK